jgi:hypothetical protein
LSQFFCPKTDKICWEKKKKKKPLLRKRIRIKELQFHVRTGVKNQQRWLILYYVTSFFDGYLILLMTTGSFLNASESENRPVPAFEEKQIRIKDPLVLF